MLKFKMGNYSADIPTTDDGIYVSQDEIGYDIDSVRYAKKNPDWQSFVIPEIDLVIDGVRTAAWYSTIISSKVNYEHELTYDKHDVVQVGDGYFVCFRINLSGLNLLEMSYRVNTSGCGIYINNTKDPTSASSPAAGAIASTSLAHDRWATSTLDVSALEGLNNIYVTTQPSWSTYIASLRIH